MPTLIAILTDNFADWEFGLLASAARGYCGIDVVTVSVDAAPLVSMGGLKVATDIAIHDIDL